MSLSTVPIRSTVINSASLLAEQRLAYSVATYHATFRAADALFGFPIGKGIDVKYPDGHVEYLPFGKDNEVKMGRCLAASIRYRLLGQGGWLQKHPWRCHGNQELDLKVVSTLNIGLGAGLGIFGVLGLVLVGRPYLPRLAFRTTRDIATLRFLRNGTAKPAQIAPTTSDICCPNCYRKPKPVAPTPEVIIIETQKVSSAPAPEVAALKENDTIIFAAPEVATAATIEEERQLPRQQLRWQQSKWTSQLL